MPSKSKSKSRSRSRSPTYVSKIETKARELTKFLLKTSIDDGGASHSFHSFENPVEIVKFLMTMEISKKKIVDFLQDRLLRDIVDDFYYSNEQQEIAEIMDEKEGWRAQKVPSSWFVHYFFTSGWVKDYIKKNNWKMKEIEFST
jgi:hypothetical protein